MRKSPESERHIMFASSALACISIIISVFSAFFSYYQLEEMRKARLMPLSGAIFERRLDILERIDHIGEDVHAVGDASETYMRDVYRCAQTSLPMDCNIVEKIRLAEDEENTLSTDVDEYHEAADQAGTMWGSPIRDQAHKVSDDLYDKNGCYDEFLVIVLKLKGGRLKLSPALVGCLKSDFALIYGEHIALRNELSTTLHLDKLDAPTF